MNGGMNLPLSRTMSWLEKKEGYKLKEETESADSAVRTVREEIALEINVIQTGSLQAMLNIYPLRLMLASIQLLTEKYILLSQ